MSITEILKTNANVQLVVNMADLKEFALSLIDEAQAARKEPEEKYLTADETARMIPCDKSTLWRWNKNGYLKSLKMGNKVRYRLSDIENLLKEAKA